MSFIEIIDNNYSHFSGNAKTWTKFAFHFTDITNAVEILASHTLYSRDKAMTAHLMHNDNASKHVIDLTSSNITSKVRFYFRPLTPTQFHNEGFKHEAVRFNGEKSANVPIPVFFVFNLDKLLEHPNIQFSEMSQAGVGSKICKTPEEFQQFDFKKIYSEGHSDNFSELKKYRHAEILLPGSYNIDDSLAYIVCRNEVERRSLLRLLLYKSITAYAYYKQHIYVSSKKNMFFYNGLYIDSCSYSDGAVIITFSESSQRMQYAMRHSSDINELLVSVTVIVKWFAAGKVYHQVERQFSIEYIDCKPLILKTDLEARTEYLETEIYFDKSLMCDILLPVNKTEIV